jgi:hypothetical protein
MKELVFISWSGQRSKAVAEALHGWLPKIIQATETWMSESDIDKGTRWGSEIIRYLEEAHFGLICLTPENLDAPWILFEAGALSKSLEKARVCTYLLNVNPTDIEWPLAQFQHTRAEKEDTRKLVHTANRAMGDTLRERQLDELFEVLWPELEQCLREIPDTQEKPGPQRSERELLTEILELLRNLTRASESRSVTTFHIRQEGMRMFEEVRQLLLKERDTVNPDASGQALSLTDLAMLQQIGVIRADFSDFADRYNEVKKLLSMIRPYTPKDLQRLLDNMRSLRGDVGLILVDEIQGLVQK